MDSTVVVEGMMVRRQRTELWLDVQFSYYDYCMAFMDAGMNLGCLGIWGILGLVIAWEYVNQKYTD